jgi:hypothetical protein
MSDSNTTGCTPRMIGPFEDGSIVLCAIRDVMLETLANLLRQGQVKLEKNEEDDRE